MSESTNELNNPEPPSTLPEFAAATTQPTKEKLFDERQRVIGEWIDNVNKVDTALGGTPESRSSSKTKMLVDHFDLNYPGTLGHLLKGRKFIQMGVILGYYQESHVSGHETFGEGRNVMFGTLEDGTKVLELEKIIYQSSLADHEHGGFSVETVSVTDKNKHEVQKVVSARLKEITEERSKHAEKERLSSLPKVELPQT